MLRRKPCSSCGRNNWRINTFEDKYECMACGAIDESSTEIDHILPISTTVTTTFTPDVSFMCFYCGQPHKVNLGETCKETVGARFDRLEKEIERLNNLLKNINL